MDYKKVLIYLGLISVTVIGLFLRLYNLAGSPPSLNWDEAALGYNAYSVSVTGRDEYGVRYPIFTRSFDEYKSTLPMYFMIPTINLFGLNETGVRMPSAIIGSIMPILLFLLVRRIFKSDSIAFLSSFLIAIEPWAVHFSRVYYEANEALFFLILGLYLFLISEKRHFLILISAFCFLISMYTYNSNKLIVPLFVVTLGIIYRKRLLGYSKKYIYLTGMLLMFGLGLFVFLVFKGEGLARAGSTNILRVWNGNLWDFATSIAGRYLAYFSPANLFVREPLEPSTVIPSLSLFFPFEFIGWVVGIIYILKVNAKKNILKVLIFLAPIPASLTWNWFQPGRGLTLFFIYSVCVAYGFVFMFLAIKNKIIKYLVIFIFICWSFTNVIWLFDAENVQLPAYETGNWQPGFQETVPLVMKEALTSDRVVIDTPQGQPYIFYLFYGKYSPEKYLSEIDLNKIGTPRHSFDFGKFEFRKITALDKNLKNTIIVISRNSQAYFDFGESDVQSIQEVFSKDNNYPIYRIIRTKL